MIDTQIVPVPCDQQASAVRAVRALVFRVVDVARVGVLDALAQRDLAGGEQRLDGRPRLVLHPEIRVERAEVQRDFRADGVQHPIAHLAEFVRRIVFAGDDQIGDLEPDVGLVLQPAQRVQHGLQVRVGQLEVELFGKRLQIDIGRVHLAEERFARRRRDVARGDRHRLDAHRPAGPRRVDRVLGPDHRIVVGVGDAHTAQFLRGAGDRLGGGMFAEPRDFFALRNVPVLAELAAQVAAGRAERQHAAAGIEMVQRLLFDRIDAEPGAAAIGGQHHPAVAVLADKTESAVTRLEHATARAQIADDAALVFAGMPPAADAGTIGQQRLVRRYHHNV